MRKLVKSLLLIGGTSFAGIPAQAQIQINALGSYISSVSDDSPIINGSRGAGGSIRYFTSPHVAIGINAQHLTKTISNGGTVVARTKNLHLAGQAEYFFTTSAWQPYVGVEIGLIRHTYRTEISDFTSGAIDLVNAGRNYFLSVGPKAGIQYMISSTVGINTEATYKLIIDGGSAEKQALLVNGGVVFKIGNQSSN